MNIQPPGKQHSSDSYIFSYHQHIGSLNGNVLTCPHGSMQQIHKRIGQGLGRQLSDPAIPCKVSELRVGSLK